MVGASDGFIPTGETAEAQAPLQIPPTRLRRRRRSWPRGMRAGLLVVAVAALSATATTLVNTEVSRRLATVPLATTSSSQVTTTTQVERAIPPRPRTEEPAPAPMTVAAPTTSTTVAMPEMRQAAYDIIAKLDKLPVRDERSLGYARYRFGLWADEDGDGCTTRDDVIVAQAAHAVRRTNPCRVLSGRWVSPYDNAVVENVNDMDVDHVVALVEAWQSGAYKWTDEQRNDYLNDIETAGAVLAVSDMSSDDKDGRDPADWLPPNTDFECRYLQSWVDVKTQWNLAVDASERESIAAAALNC